MENRFIPIVRLSHDKHGFTDKFCYMGQAAVFGWNVCHLLSHPLFNYYNIFISTNNICCMFNCQNMASASRPEPGLSCLWHRVGHGWLKISASGHGLWGGSCIRRVIYEIYQSGSHIRRVWVRIWNMMYFWKRYLA